MLEVANSLFTSSPFIPHGHCYLWQPQLVGLHLIADLLIALAYYSIPITLIYFVRKRTDLPYPEMFLLFGAFITACGTTHVMGIWTLWHPNYWLSGLVKCITAIISMYTAATLLPLVPQALALPSPSQLEAANRGLEREIGERRQIESALKQAHGELENRVRERTAELVTANEQLQKEIAEREQTQEALLRSERQNRAILEAIPDLLLRVNREGSCLECQLPKDLRAGFFIPIEGHLREILPPELLQQQLHCVEQALVTGELQVYEHQLLKQGQLTYEELRLTAISDNEVLIIVRDITARKQAEDALRESENQLRLITDALPVLVSYVDRQECYRFNNRAYEEWFDHPRGELMGQTLEGVLGGEAYSTIAPYVRSVLAGQEVIYEATIPYQEGGTRHVHATYLPHFGESGEVHGFIALVSDISERKQLEENLRQAKEELEKRVQERTKQLMKVNQALQQSEARYRAIVEDQTELITRFRPDGVLTFVNEAYCRYFGVTRERIVGDRYEPLIYEADREKVYQLVNSITPENPVVTIKNRVVVAGQIRWTQWINRMISDDQARLVEFQSVGRDITELQNAYEELELRVQERTKDLAQANRELQSEIAERKRIEADLRASEQRLQLAIEGAGMGTWDRDLKTGKVLWSAQHFKLLGYEPVPSGEATLDMWCDRLHPDDSQRVIQALEDARVQHSLYNPEHRIIRADNQRLSWLSAFGRYLYDETGQAVRCIGVVFETTERKQTEEQIKASLREKEVLLQEIHHRVKNNLQVICSLLNLQSRNIQDRVALEILKESQNRIRSMALIHEKLYQSEDLSRFNFAEYICYLINNLFRSYGVNTNKITLRTDISNRILLDVDAAVNCGLIVNELISNTLKYAFLPEQEGLISVKIQMTEEQGLVMLISDDGIGLLPNFDWENTKTLGLKLVKSWVAQLNGTLEVNPHSPGTEFKIKFAPD